MADKLIRGQVRRNSPSRTWARAARRGVTLLELMIVVAVLMVVFLATSRSLVTSMRMTESNREVALATDGARAMVEQLGGTEEFLDVFALYNDEPGDDPGLPGSAPGSGFPVFGLEPLDGDPDGLVGEIVFPTIGSELREDADMPELGMPRDLDGNGLLDSDPHSEDYMLLPVIVRLEWQSGGMERRHEIRTLIADR